MVDLFGCWSLVAVDYNPSVFLLYPECTAQFVAYMECSVCSEPVLFLLDTALDVLQPEGWVIVVPGFEHFVLAFACTPGHTHTLM